jgi:predicted AlkP superfamily pyrophosphatase or phosphodiesterase
LLKRLSVTFFVEAFILALLLILPLPRSKAQQETEASHSRPKLIVMIVIDQFPYNYLVRFRPYFVQGGFNMLLGGANFIACRYDDAITATGPGHAALATGAYPDVNGIIGNAWYDRSAHRETNCVGDDSTRLVGGTEGPGRSPHLLIGDTFADELRLETEFKSRVVSVSLKDRGAILPAGHTANAAYWYDVETGHFVTSTYYMKSLPAWAEQFNSQPPAKAYCGKPWRALAETPGVGGQVLREFKGNPGESCPDRRFLGWLNNTPAMSEIQLDFAREAVKNEHLGQGPATDFLAISLSENDHIGHAYGPYSPQVADMTLRTDRDLAAFFKDLDRIVGLDNVWITLSADHGVAPSPWFIEKHRLGPGRASTGAIGAAVSRALSKEFGPGNWIEGTSEFELYLNHDSLQKQGISLGRAEIVAAQAAATVPGVTAAFTRSQILTGNLPANPVARKVSHSFNSQRSGDVYLVLAPYAVPVEGETGTTHGSPWSYDAQVPLIFWGSAFKPGVYRELCQPIDLAPTLAAAMGLGQPSDSEGRVLTEALK